MLLGSTAARAPGRRASVLIVDHNAVYAAALQASLGDCDEISVDAVAASIDGGVRVALLQKPDVILVEYKFPDRLGQSICSRLRRKLPGTAVIVMSASDDPEIASAARAAGAAGWALKGTPGAVIADMVVRTARGESQWGAAEATRAG